MFKKLFSLAMVAIVFAAAGCCKNSCKKECDEGCGCKGESQKQGYEKWCCGHHHVKNYKSPFFYKKNGLGAYDEAKAKQAYYDMMHRFCYPIPEVLKTDQFWTCDFLQHDFAKLGMGGIFWINEMGTYGEPAETGYNGKFKGQLFGFLGHDIYLLPGQALPEHNHLGGPKGRAPKMEAWHVRYGTVRFFSAYKGDKSKKIEDLPKDEQPWGFGEPWFHCKYYADGKAGTVHKLIKPEGYHFQQALSEGAIVTEYGTCHNHVQFSKPGMEFKNSK